MGAGTNVQKRLVALQCGRPTHASPLSWRAGTLGVGGAELGRLRVILWYR
jgi:hypothetical protein